MGSRQQCLHLVKTTVCFAWRFQRTISITCDICNYIFAPLFWIQDTINFHASISSSLQCQLKTSASAPTLHTSELAQSHWPRAEPPGEIIKLYSSEIGRGMDRGTYRTDPIVTNRPVLSFYIVHNSFSLGPIWLHPHIGFFAILKTKSGACCSLPAANPASQAEQKESLWLRSIRRVRKELGPIGCSHCEPTIPPKSWDTDVVRYQGGSQSLGKYQNFANSAHMRLGSWLYSPAIDDLHILAHTCTFSYEQLNNVTMLQVTSHYPAWRVNHEETESWDIAEMWWKALENQVIPGFVLNLSIEVQWTGPSLLWCSTKGGLAIEPPKWASCLDVRPDSDAWFVDSFCSKVELKQSWYPLLQTVVVLPRMHQNEFNTKWNRHYARPNPLPQAQMFIFLPKYLKHYQTTLTRLLHALFTQRQKECLLCRPFEYVPAVTLEKSFEIAEMSLLAGSLSFQTWQVIGMCVTRSKEPISFRRWPGCEGTQAGSSCAISNKVWLRLGISWIFSHGMSKRLGLAA